MVGDGELGHPCAPPTPTISTLPCVAASRKAVIPCARGQTAFVSCVTRSQALELRGLGREQTLPVVAYATVPTGDVQRTDGWCFGFFYVCFSPRVGMRPHLPLVGALPGDSVPQTDTRSPCSPAGSTSPGATTTHSTTVSKPWLARLALVAVACLYGTEYIAVKFVVGLLGTSYLLTLRFSLASLVLLPAIKGARAPRLSRLGQRRGSTRPWVIGRRPRRYR